jgi:hypothetical protein
MKDKSIIWLCAGGVALWVFFAYPPVREEVFRISRHVWNYISGIF